MYLILTLFCYQRQRLSLLTRTLVIITHMYQLFVFNLTPEDVLQLGRLPFGWNWNNRPVTRLKYSIMWKYFNTWCSMTQLFKVFNLFHPWIFRCVINLKKINWSSTWRSSNWKSAYAYYNPVTVRQISLENIQAREALETFFCLLAFAVLNYSTQSANLNICASFFANLTNLLA